MLFLKYTQTALCYSDPMAKLTIVNYLSSFTNLNEIYTPENMENKEML